MIDNIWLCEPNDARESWCFLELKLKKQDANDVISGWEATYANPNRVVHKANDTRSDEKESLKKLFFHIYRCRKKEIPIITFGSNVIPVLRTRILCQGIRDESLRSVKTISLQKILQDYFCFDNDNSILSASDFVAGLKIEQGNATETELLYDVFTRIGPLLPAGVI